MVLGLNRPQSGRILFGGRDVCAMNDAQFHKLRRRFGVLFQDGALLSSLTLAENVALPLMEHTKLPRKLLRDAALRTLELVGTATWSRAFRSCFVCEGCASHIHQF